LDSVLVGKGLAAELSLELDDIDRTIKLGTYQGFGAAIGFDGVALFFEDTHRSAPPDDRVTAPDFLGGTGVAQSETAAAASGDQTSQKIKSTGSLEISPGKTPERTAVHGKIAGPGESERQQRVDRFR